MLTSPLCEAARTDPANVGGDNYICPRRHRPTLAAPLLGRGGEGATPAPRTSHPPSSPHARALARAVTTTTATAVAPAANSFANAARRPER